MSARRLAEAVDTGEPALDAGHATALHWFLRLGVAACFGAHGIFGIIAKEPWVPYFAAGEVSEPWAWRLAPATDLGDISIGLLTLFWPLPAVLLGAAFWGFRTAGPRSLPVWELLEHASTFGIPLALWWSAGWPRSLREWFSPVRPAPLSELRAQQVSWILRVTTAALLIGHGALGALMHQREWVGYFAAIGVAPGTVNRLSLTDVAGSFEIGLGLAILAWPWPGLPLLACAWKLGTESLRLLAGEPTWEFIARGGSYAAPLALLWLQAAIGSPGATSRMRSLRHLHRLRALLGIGPTRTTRGQHVAPEGGHGDLQRRVAREAALGDGAVVTRVDGVEVVENRGNVPFEHPLGPRRIQVGQGARRPRPQGHDDGRQRAASCPTHHAVAAGQAEAVVVGALRGLDRWSTARLLVLVNTAIARRLHRWRRYAVPRRLLPAGDGHRRRRYGR